MSDKINSIGNYSIVLVNYKSLEMTSICLDLLKIAVNPSEVPIWVVDNNSNDESLVYLKSLDWIHLIERISVDHERGYMAHGCALDMVLERITTPYFLLLHTDTFIHDPKIIDIMLSQITADDKVAAVGCREPELRSFSKNVGRVITRGAKYYFRKFKVVLGIKTRTPRPHYEIYLKSYCALWNVKIIKRHGMSFSLNNRTPSYEMQDRLPELGYRFVDVSAKVMFEHLDHIEKGTISATKGFRKDHRRINDYQEKLKKFNRK